VVGSKNSSNSNRLREVARTRGIPAYLIDHAAEVDPAWLEGVERIGVTAGASAPEYLVEELTGWLQEHGAASVREMDGEDEAVHFQLPDLAV
jgi:4-hydroxy-3-methylbut-2-enyl diphosphate reductase